MEVRESFFNQPLQKTSFSFHSRIKVSPEARSIAAQEIPPIIVQQQIQALEQQIPNPHLLVLAVAENNVEKLKQVIAQVGKSVIPALRFEHDMNILNLAIDQESVQVVEFLASYYSEDNSLVKHQYAKGMQAIH